MSKETAIIAAGGSLSAPVQLTGNVRALLVPASWVEAPVTFQESLDEGQSFQNVYDAAGAEVSVTVVPGGITSIDGVLTAHWDSGAANIALGRLLRLRSGTADTPVVQTEEAIITLSLR